MSLISDCSISSTGDALPKAKKAVNLRKIEILQRQFQKATSLESFDSEKDYTAKKFDISEALRKYQINSNVPEPYTRSLEELKEIFEKHNDFLSECIENESHALNEVKNDVKIWEDRVAVLTEALALTKKTNKSKINVKKLEAKIDEDLSRVDESLEAACNLALPNDKFIYQLIKHLIDAQEDNIGYINVQNNYYKHIAYLKHLKLVEPHPTQPDVYKLVDIDQTLQ